MIRRVLLAITLAIGLTALAPASPAQATVGGGPGSVLWQYYYTDASLSQLTGILGQNCNGSTYEWGYYPLGGYEVDYWYDCSNR